MMHDMGLTKLAEECGELTTAATKLASMIEHSVSSFEEPYVTYSFTHYDGHDLKAALEDEMADVRAALTFVVRKFGLDTSRIDQRTGDKLALYHMWDRES